MYIIFCKGGGGEGGGGEQFDILLVLHHILCLASLLLQHLMILNWWMDYLDMELIVTMIKLAFMSGETMKSTLLISHVNCGFRTTRNWQLPYVKKYITTIIERKKELTILLPLPLPPPKKNNTNKNKDNKVKKSNDLMGFIYSHTYQI